MHVICRILATASADMGGSCAGGYLRSTVIRLLTVGLNTSANVGSRKENWPILVNLLEYSTFMKIAQRPAID